MENNDKELMAELEDIVNNAEGKILDDVENEATHIFSELCKQFDEDIPVEVQTVLLGLQEVDDPDEIADAKSRARGGDKAVMSQFIGSLDEEGCKTMKLSSIVSDLDPENFLDMLQDTDTSVLLCEWFEPKSLVSRVRYEGCVLQVMVTAGTVHFIKTLPTGDKVTKFWGRKKHSDGKTVYPERSDFANDYEYDLCRGTYKYLAMPMEMKQESREAYDTLLNAIAEKMQRAMRRSMESDDE